MKKFTARLSVQLTLVGLLLTLLGYLFWQSRPIERSLHEQLIQNINILQQADAKLSELLLKVQYQQLKNYDPVNQTLAVMDQRLTRLPQLLNQLGEGNHDVLCQSLVREQQRLVQKQADWEALASQTAVRKNSLYYANLMLEQARQVVENTQQQKLLDQLAQRLFYLPNLSQDTQSIDHLLEALSDVGVTNAARLESHAQIVELSSAATSALLERLLSPAFSVGEDLENNYRLFEESTNQKAASYQIWLALIAGLLLLLTAYTFHRLQTAFSRQAHLRKALDEHAIVSITDAAGFITYANEKFRTISGYREEELLGRTHKMINSGYHPHEFFAQLWQTISAGQVWHGQVRNQSKTGELYWVNATVVPFLNTAGKIEEYISIRTDVTAQKQLEAGLIAAKDAAEAGNRAKSDFLATMSHEIRTPMNGILGMTEIALDTNLDDEQREYIQIVKDSADALMVVINDILDFSKIESGKFELDPQPFTLSKTMTDAIRTLEARATQKGLAISVQLSNDIPDTLIGDAARLRQILLNLLGNAVKFTEQGYIKLHLSLIHQDKQRVQLQFVVSDTGIGIAADKLEHIFEAFSQADSSVTRQYGGTGLGLAICSRLVEMMDGQIRVESELGHGSRFSFTAFFDLPSP